MEEIIMLDFEYYTEVFENLSHRERGIEYWYARDLQKSLAIDNSDEFSLLIDKAQQKYIKYCGTSTKKYHFYRDTVADELMLSRYACQLLMQFLQPINSQILAAKKFFITTLPKYPYQHTKRVSNRQLIEFLSLLSKNAQDIMREIDLVKNTLK